MPEKRKEHTGLIESLFGKKEKSAGLSDAMGVVERINDETLKSGDMNKALNKMGVDEPGIKTIVSYLDRAKSRNTGKRGADKGFELGQISLLLDELKKLLPRKVKPSQSEDKGGKKGKIRKSKKWQYGGFTQED